MKTYYILQHRRNRGYKWMRRGGYGTAIGFMPKSWVDNFKDATAFDGSQAAVDVYPKVKGKHYIMSRSEAMIVQRALNKGEVPACLAK